MKYNFTDGPWCVVHNPKNDEWIPGMSISSDFGRICDIFGRVEAEFDGNRRLIAAAPALFDCVLELIAHPGDLDVVEKSQELINSIYMP